MARGPMLMANMPRERRTTRRPVHEFYTTSQPMQLIPLAIAPVLPGETLRNFKFQIRAVTDPVANPLIGWWFETYWFYVKVVDLGYGIRSTPEGDVLKNMFLEQGYDVSSLYSTSTNVAWGHRDDQIPYMQLCTEKVVHDWFREPGEAVGLAPSSFSTPYPLVAINRRGWWDSIAAKSAIPETDLDTADVVTDEDIDQALRAYEFMKLNGMINMDYEDFLASYGIASPERQKPHTSELIRYSRNWQYPSNTIDPLTGAATSALSWSIQDRADKDRFFREPGFIVGYCVARPKVYYREQDSHAVSMLASGFSWLPAVLRDDPATSLALVDNATTMPWSGLSEDYWVDVKDLFMHGDMFNTSSRVADDRNFVDLPGSTGQHRFISNTDAQKMFVQPETPANRFLRLDGRVDFVIAGNQKDTTPSTFAM